MSKRRTIGNLLAMAGLFGSSLMPDSLLREGLRYLAFGYILFDLILRARSGYLRRQPHWTSDSWRRYLTACSVPIGALLALVFMVVALDWKLPFVGESRSFTRGVWAAGSLFFMMVGALGLVSVIEWLHEGDPSHQFSLPRWLRRRSDSTA